MRTTSNSKKRPYGGPPKKDVPTKGKRRALEEEEEVEADKPPVVIKTNGQTNHIPVCGKTPEGFADWRTAMLRQHIMEGLQYVNVTVT